MQWEDIFLCLINIFEKKHCGINKIYYRTIGIVTVIFLCYRERSIFAQMSAIGMYAKQVVLKISINEGKDRIETYESR